MRKKRPDIAYGDRPHQPQQQDQSGLSDVLPTQGNNDGDGQTESQERQPPEADDKTLWETITKPELTKPAKSPDLEPWSDGFYGLLQAADGPAVDPQDDSIHGGEEDLPPEARQCSQQVRRLIRNAHRNLGHPSNFSLVRLMTIARYHPDMIAYAAHYKCPTCQRRQPTQKIPRTPMPYRPTQFNTIVGVDLKWIKDVGNNTYYLFNILGLSN